MPNHKPAGLSEREKLMLPTSFAVIILVLYGVFRFKPASDSVGELKEQLAKAVKGRETLEFPNNRHLSVPELKTKLESLRAQLEQTDTALTKAEANLVDLDDSSKFQNLKIELSDLAHASGLTIIESVPYGIDGKAKASRNFYVDLDRIPDPTVANSAPVVHEFFQTLYARPLQIMTVEASFMGLLRFVHGLDALSRQVCLMSFDVSAEVQDQRSIQSLDPPRLRANIILVM